MRLTKRITYEQGLARIDEALEKKFWLEASWISYAMFEDRCDSLLEKSGGPVPPPKSGSFVSINKKINVLKQRCVTDQFLSQFPELPQLLDEIHDWKERRNPIMHSMVELPRDWSSINADAEPLAKNGRDILRRFVSAVMKVRTKYKKAGN